MRIEEDVKLDFSDVLIRPKRSTLTSRSEVSVMRDFVFPNTSQIWRGFPIVVANMTSVATLPMLTAIGMKQGIVALHKYHQTNSIIPYLRETATNPDSMAVTIGIKNPGRSIGILQDLDERMSNEVGYTFPFICIDVANGYMEKFAEVVTRIRDNFPDKIIIAGNVVTGEMTEQLILSGADIVKVGIGSGAQCLTRRVTGVGMPQLSAIIECADAAHGMAGHIMSDGGITCAGDVVKAFGGGADFVMMGSMFGGTNESEGDSVVLDGVRYKRIYGMSSEYANEQYADGMADYRASEGRQTLVECKGPVSNVIQEIEGGIRSAMTYMGAVTLKQIPKCCTFVRVRNQINNSYAGNPTF